VGVGQRSRGVLRDLGRRADDDQGVLELVNKNGN